MKELNEVLSKHNIETNDDLISDLKKVTTGIPQDRLSEVVAERNEFKSKLKDLQDKYSDYDSLNAKVITLQKDRDEFKSKWTQHQEKVNEDLKKKWTEKSKVFEVNEGEDGYNKINKIKDKFKFDEDISIDDIKSNLQMYSVYEEIDYFNVNKKDTDTSDTPNIKSKSSNSKGNFYGYSSLKELTGSSPNGWKLAKKWLDEHGG